MKIKTFQPNPEVLRILSHFDNMKAEKERIKNEKRMKKIKIKSPVSIEISVGCFVVDYS